MSVELGVLALTAVSVGFFHTLFGPDHYLPFIVMAKARKWSLFKTSWITFLCGIGHIGSSVVLGLLGVALGIAVHRLEAFESFRGNLAGWLLLGFGLVYFAWGVRRAVRNVPHAHLHPHIDGAGHEHVHTHDGEHLHVHAQAGKVSVTPWVLFTIFVFGPCEPLIPILMYPAAKHSTSGLVLVTALFGTATIGTMMVIVLGASLGMSFVPMKKIERWNHALAGLAIVACGVAIQFLGL